MLKLIRRNLSDVEKKKVQSRLQAAYKQNGDGFYVHAPKQRGNVKEELGYIGRYMRRRAIAIHRHSDSQLPDRLIEISNG
ncbi:transposase [Paenibacillus sp. GCM10027628]|uniref:transposase n=1 Tax=Paenibacillus sp. GCM10027628 TaxID=3273413 RepID=UPI00362FB7F0